MTGASSQREARRAIDGVLLLDKPRGYTSNQALQQAKRLLNAVKAGHTGNLDPIATGLLPLCFGEATKLARFLLDTEKRYSAVFRLGVTTATFDGDGEVLKVRPVSIDRDALERALADFRGEIDQIPPMYSALKRGGRPLYEFARAGVEVERAARRVVIRELALKSFDRDRVEVEIACSKGTYIRSLAYDLGEQLGCGAHVCELRRLAVGDLTVASAMTLEKLAAMCDSEERARALVPADRILSAIPDVRLTLLATHYVLRGQAVSVRHPHAPGWVRLYDSQDRFLGMGQVLDDGRVAPRRLVTQRF
jgi:tRNA pseudouridine55 synthase